MRDGDGGLGLLTAPELTPPRGGSARGTPARALVLMAEDKAAFFQIVRRHLNCDPVSGQRLDAVLLHLTGGVGDDFVSGIKLDAISCVGKDFRDQSFELDQLFFRHRGLQVL